MDYMTFISENYVAIILVLVIVLMTIIGYFADKKYSGNALPVEKKPKEKKKKEKKKKETNKKEEVKEEIKDEFDMPTDLEPVVNEMDELNNFDFNDVPEVKPLPVEDSMDVKPNNMFDDIPAELFEGVENVYTNQNVEESTDNTNADSNQNVEESIESTIADSNQNDNIPEEPTNLNDSQDVIQDIDDWTTIEPTSQEEEKVSYDEVEAPVDENLNSEWNNASTVPLEEENVSDDNITFDGIADEEFNLPTIEKLDDELSNVVDDEDDVWKF